MLEASAAGPGAILRSDCYRDQNDALFYKVRKKFAQNKAAT